MKQVVVKQVVVKQVVNCVLKIGQIMRFVVLLLCCAALAPASWAQRGDFLSVEDFLEQSFGGSAPAMGTLWLTREQAASYLGVPVAVFERRRRDAGIRHVPGRMVGGDPARLYRKVDVEKLKR